jgi:PAS domain S-box-containing protein
MPFGSEGFAPIPSSSESDRSGNRTRRSLLRPGKEPLLGRGWKTDHSVFLAAILIILAFNALILSEVADSRHALLKAAEQTTGNLAFALEEQTGKALLSVEQLMTGIGENLLLRAAETAPETWDADAIAAFMRRRLVHTPHVLALLILDADGNLQIDSDDQTTRTLNLSDRDYFKIHRDDPNYGLFIGGPLQGRDTGRWFIPISRRAASESGKFIGTIVAIVAPEHFQASFDGLNIGNGGDVGLYLTDGTLLVHSPLDADLVGKSFASHPLFGSPALDAVKGTVWGIGPVDDKRRVTSYRTIPGRPLVITVGQSEREVLEPWRRKLLVDALIAGSVTVTVALFAFLLIRQLGRREAFARRLAEAERDYRGLFDNLPDGIYRSSPSGQLLRANSALVRLCGYRDEGELLAAISSNTGNWYIDPQRPVEFRRLLERDGIVTNFVSEIRRHHTDERIWILENATLVHSDDGAPLFCEGTVRDITDLRKAEEELRIAKDQAEEASRAKSQILANMSHELRTPLNAILGFAECLRDQLFGPLGSERYRSYAADIHSSGEHLLNLINEILDLAKIEAGRFELDEDPVDVVALLDDCRRLVRDRSDRAGLKLSFTPPRAPIRLRGDRIRLKQVVLNLLSNAIKFTPAPGQITMVLERSAGTGLVIAITDTGIGMHSDEIPVALEPFRQIGGTLNRHQDGTGLGLPLAKSLVEMHGGRLDIVSAPGEGTTVRVTLPETRLI